MIAHGTLLTWARDSRNCFPTISAERGRNRCAKASMRRVNGIINESGALVAEVLTPSRQEGLFAGANSVLLLRKDANAVQTVAQCVLTAQR